MGAGVEEIRLSGGEPALRNDIEKLIGMPLTANGSLLARNPLKDAGLRCARKRIMNLVREGA